jgi:hypothetical protein
MARLRLRQIEAASASIGQFAIYVMEKTGVNPFGKKNLPSSIMDVWSRA